MVKMDVELTTSKPGPKPKYKTKEERRVAQLESNKRYRLSEKGRLQKKKDDAKYSTTDKGRQARSKAQKKFIQTDKGKNIYKKYWQSEKGRLLLQAYWRSQRGKSISRSNAALRRQLIRSQIIKEHFYQEILDIYANCPTGYEVDHVLPIKHELLCGLHVPWNLQYLPRSENRSKSNKV